MYPSNHTPTHKPNQARTQVRAIRDMRTRLSEAHENEEHNREDSLLHEINYFPVAAQSNGETYSILLNTVGDPVRIRGTVNEKGVPTSAHVEIKDGFNQWETAGLSPDNREDVLWFARQFQPTFNQRENARV